MKKKNLNSKFTLNKQVLSNLNDVKAGAAITKSWWIFCRSTDQKCGGSVASCNQASCVASPDCDGQTSLNLTKCVTRCNGC